jgi:hypothetical protein
MTVAAKRPNHFQSVDARQPEVEKHDVDWIGVGGCEALFARSHAYHVVSGEFEGLCKVCSLDWLVLDYQNLGQDRTPEKRRAW